MARIFSEFDLIRKIKKYHNTSNPAVLCSIGDDAAVFTIPQNEKIVITTDLFVEESHFRKDFSSFYDIGYKVMAANLSDIAAMGATPHYAFISIAIPKEYTEESILELYQGISDIGKQFNTTLLGGDTTLAPSQMALNVALVGSALEEELLYRSGAHPEDLICTTKSLGDSYAGLQLLLHPPESITEPFAKLITKHLRPTPHVHEGRFLAKSNFVTACIDISDGLSGDIGHLAIASNVGVHLFENQLPISEELKFFTHTQHASSTQFSLTGGEEYGLLFTISPNKLEELQKKYLETFGTSFWVIGKITPIPSDRLFTKIDGSVCSFENTGWDHFSDKNK